MAVATASPERIEAPPQNPIKDPSPSPSRLSTDAPSEAERSPSPLLSCSADTPNRSETRNSSPTADLSAASLRSEEYRQLFRLPPEEVLIEDFNCAFQENILIQGHMYLFVHYICFYSNIFGFETKKIIPFQEVTSVRRAKTAGIFPNAIEIFAGSKKYFFASFLSRDEALKIINDGWLQFVDGGKEFREQDLLSETGSQENGVGIEKVESSQFLVNELESTDRDIHVSQDSKLASSVVDDSALTSIPEQHDIVKEDLEPAQNSDPSCSKDTLIWKEENSDAPNVPECYTKVAESQFPIKVEDFFSLFFSDDVFTESFHRSCGDKELKCTPWNPHDKFGFSRDVSFQHPIKIYFGAKFGSCQELQKFRVHRNSHLVIETSQEINDVPYGDYFRVEGFWDIERDPDVSKDCCNLKIYANVAFSKRTVWKGKIVQSTMEECREVFETWINMAHELLKKKNLEKQEERIAAVTIVQKFEVHPQIEAEMGVPTERFYEPREHTRVQHMSKSLDAARQVGKRLLGGTVDVSPLTSWLRESMLKFQSSLRSPSQLPLIIVIVFVVIFIMQLSILALLARPQHIHVQSPVDYGSGLGSQVGERSSEVVAWLEKRIHHLKDEMRLVETRLESMQHEHALLKAQLKDINHLSKRSNASYPSKEMQAAQASFEQVQNLNRGFLPNLYIKEQEHKD
ncbi:protein VASCULAR ASSOCIATED DEATH 1, chloroplastic-like isoform X2 [Malus sylvestris]|uniref:protein VASCULAR ASSOCIATED DEATH 1, chloroplastic-like isoform X2 n=1 Tax=Malus sylvestris TaxID=3752 RepID=UPI0010AACCB5|nr:protein VASCULAR ASSOCIATED DEATH 1, chloroplastic-like isoform X2 [Malus domestica]XP_050154884.1 protein VASCULAR ASSOCIATED DEATH 1, chloroplastic-like isoform X2 [Malus sylvestris]